MAGSDDMPLWKKYLMPDANSTADYIYCAVLVALCGPRPDPARVCSLLSRMQRTVRSRATHARARSRWFLVGRPLLLKASVASAAAAGTVCAPAAAARTHA
jgi:hypothetical protein